MRKPMRRAIGLGRLNIDVSADGMRLPVSMARILDASRRALRAERVNDALLSIAFISDRRMAALNWEHLCHRGSTDVLAFGFAPTTSASVVVGDVYIAPGVARRNALAHGERIRDELLRLVVHGTLHVAGRDHPAGVDRYASAMWTRQEQVLRQLARVR